MKNLYILMIFSLVLTGCTVQHQQTNNQTKGECKIIDRSDLSLTRDITKIQCKNTVYKCFTVISSYGGGIDCIEVNNE